MQHSDSLARRCHCALVLACVHSLLQVGTSLTASVDNYGPDSLFPGYAKDDMSLWIDEAQVKQFFNGFPMNIYVIMDGVVLHQLLDPNFEKNLPVIPSEVTAVNFTWKAGENRNYTYMFYELQSYNKDILNSPIISISPSGHVPRKPTEFEVLIPCVGNTSGVATFTLGLRIVNEDVNQNLATIRLKLQKQCSYRGPDPECDKKCGNGKCNQDTFQCVCATGFLGKYCESALCYPQCMNGGTCVAPGKCMCSHGFQGLHCEGGICAEKCLNGGRCIQKDKCRCGRGYYGPRCQYSKCHIPCLNGGKCVGVNRCRCKKAFSGNQCQSPRKVSRRGGKYSGHGAGVSKKKSRRKFV